ncbi:hypothetical protein SLE2022_093420 [Rubroshorea leprosula]
MSRDASSSRFVPRDALRNAQHEANENEFECSPDQAHFPPPRTPLNAIVDPSQSQKEKQSQQCDFYSKDKSESAKPDRKSEMLNLNLINAAYRGVSRHGKVHSEPNSAHSTPARSSSRMSLGGGVSAGSRVTEVFGGSGVNSSSSSRVSRRISMIDTSDLCIDVPHFELDEDASFWTDHNVQVLIRIRPLSTVERVSRGYGRCLRQESAQTLLWLGHPETRFTFDHVACETISQEKLFRVAGLPMVENCMSGYNSCMFAYGQTGSGKTYTMMGDINIVEGNLHEDCGITPRIFEYLFSRIRKEEENRKDERLKFSCKCSFLEIYNEQITDLLEPSSTNLQLREDLKKGVYVENLKEYNVRTVNDVVKLLLQGGANRKMAPTCMNSESSRSHSVFTCIIESHWEKDSMTHFRFARLNLVDLAGSERQKSSGAEGDRLKEAANINKSLSTLGLVIMSLVDLAHGKHRHIPYRDSRLTFLLQDSLGGNSKTTIIANVSPSICAAYETLSTLKFAQRAKLIQNDAKVNEDASGDVSALQRQIQKLKGQLSSLMKHQKIPCSPYNSVPSIGESKSDDYSEKYEYSREKAMDDYKMKRLEATLMGSLRREKAAEIAIQKLEAEIEQINRLACQREEEAQCTKMILNFREEKIQKNELLVSGLISAEKYLMEENKALKEEIKLLRAKIDRNPEVTRFALENIRLLEQLQMLQNFCGQGERETLLGEISELRDQLLEVLEERPRFSSEYEKQGGDTMKELEDCRNMNSKLMREVDELRTELRKHMNYTGEEPESVAVTDSLAKDPDDYFLGNVGIDPKALQDKLDKLTKELEEARILNFNYEQDQALQSSHLQQADLVREQVEMETTKTILHLQDEVAAIQLELTERLSCVTKENLRLRNMIASKEEEIRTISMEWERATLELTSFLLDGSRSIKDASCQMKSIASSIPQINVWVGEHVERAARVCIEKEEKILLLQRSLEAAQRMVVDMELKLSSLEGATIALNEFQQAADEETAAEEAALSTLLNDKIRMVMMLESELKLKADQIIEAEKRADAASLTLRWLLDSNKVAYGDEIERDALILKLASSSGMCGDMISEREVDTDSATMDGIKVQAELAKSVVLECQNILNASFVDTKLHLSTLQNDILNAFSAYKEMVQELRTGIHEMRSCIRAKATANVFALSDENLIEADGCSTDSSTSSSDTSTESFASGKNLNGSCFSGKTTEEVEDLKFESCGDQEPQKWLTEKIIHEEAVTLSLKKELQKAFDSFHKIYVGLTTLLNVSDDRDCSYGEEMKYTIPSFGLKAEADSKNAREFSNSQAVADEKISHTGSFLKKIEAAHATMKEAEYMLKALLNQNKNAKESNNMLQQASEELMAERAILIREVEQLRYLINLKERENESLQDQMNNSLGEISSSITLLEKCFLQMQSQAEDSFEVLYSDILSTKQDILNSVSNSRSALEDTFLEIIEKEFTMFVLYQCHVGDFFRKNSNFKGELGAQMYRKQEQYSVWNIFNQKHLIGQNDLVVSCKGGIEKGTDNEEMDYSKEEEPDLPHDELVYENLSLKKELERKEVLLEGLLFDLHLLQESASNRMDIKDESEKLIFALSQVRHELEEQTMQLDDLLVQHSKLENQLIDAENALFISKSNLELANGTVESLLDQNAEMRVLVKDLFLQKHEAEDRIEEQKEVIRGLENEIIYLNSSGEKDLLSSVESAEEKLREVASERDKLNEEVHSLNDKLEMAYALVDEKEAIAVEARQESEASKLYAEQKEEEVKILENSVEELECTVNVLEKKVYEMNEEVDRHQLIRNSLEHELQAMRERLTTFDNFHAVVDSFNKNAGHTEDQISRLLELNEAHDRIRILEKEKAELSSEVKQCKEYISELVLHSEAQAAQYQQKYKTLESMVREVKTELSNSASIAPLLDKTERCSTRTRGSSSPFRCIANLVQQMNLEKDQELSIAKLQIGELEELAANRQKEVCMLNTRLAAAESMTHDVIRDLLCVKLDMTNYANLIDQHQVQKFVEDARKQTEDFLEKEQEILKLRKQIHDLVEERESCTSEVKRKDADILAIQMSLEQLQQRDQLLSAQNEMLKMDKTNLIKKVAELDEIVKASAGTQSNQKQIRQASSDIKMLATSERRRANDELAQYRKANGHHLHDKTYGHGHLEARYRKQKASKD